MSLTVACLRYVLEMVKLDLLQLLVKNIVEIILQSLRSCRPCHC